MLLFSVELPPFDQTVNAASIKNSPNINMTEEEGGEWGKKKNLFFFLYSIFLHFPPSLPVWKKKIHSVPIKVTNKIIYSTFVTAFILDINHMDHQK